jgi:hypothetical protein
MVEARNGMDLDLDLLDMLIDAHQRALHLDFKVTFIVSCLQWNHRNKIFLKGSRGIFINTLETQSYAYYERCEIISILLDILYASLAWYFINFLLDLFHSTFYVHITISSNSNGAVEVFPTILAQKEV